MIVILKEYYRHCKYDREILINTTIKIINLIIIKRLNVKLNY